MLSELYNKDRIQQKFDWKCASMKKWEVEDGYKNL